LITVQFNYKPSVTRGISCLHTYSPFTYCNLLKQNWQK